MAEASGGANEGTQENFDLDTSNNLNSILNDFGLTKKSISNRRYCMQLCNLMLHVPMCFLNDVFSIAYLSGSSVEGVALLADQTSDMDIMMISPINVINAIDQIDNQVKHFPIHNGVYVLEDSISHCLYKRLRFVAGESLEPHYHHSNGYTYFSHSIISELCHNFRELREMVQNEILPNNMRNYLNYLSSISCTERCGPSFATSVEFAPSHIWDMDLVVAIFCPFWPNEINDFFVRHRPHQWPTPRDLDLIIRNGCHFVAKGFERSMEYQIEWRLSFSFAENILIRSFNNIQMKCYFLLKKFLKRNIKPRFPKLLCSYHMKTVMFWVCEEIGPNQFKTKILLKCFRLCIERIGSYLLEGHFPCYFAPEVNLLSETVPREEYRKVAEFVSIVYHEETITTFVGYLKGDSQIFKFEFLPREKMYPVTAMSFRLKSAMEYWIEISKRKSTKELQSYLNHIIFEIIEKSLFHAYPELNILNVLRQILFPDIAFTAVALLRRRQIRNKLHYALQKHYLELMSNELAVAHSNGLLKRATVYYKTGQFTRCIVIAVNVINQLTATNVLCFAVHPEETEWNFQLLCREYTFPDGNVDITPNVTFSELDKPLVPDFIIEEMNFVEHIGGQSTKGWAFLDPVIYAYGLAIICQHEQSDFAARDQFLQDLQHFFLQNRYRIVYQNSAKRIIDHFIGQFCRQ